MVEPKYLIYQFGKVGSRTLRIGLSSHGYNNVVHTHLHDEAMLHLDHGYEQPVVVLTGFREPLTRCISAYFQNLSNQSVWYVGTKAQVLQRDVNWLIRDFNRKVAIDMASYVKPWFENFLKVCECNWVDFVDLGYAWKASKKEKAFYIYKQECMADFLMSAPELAGIEFSRENHSSSRWYSALYQEFRSTYSIAQESYRSLFGATDYVPLLYSEKELAQIVDPYLR